MAALPWGESMLEFSRGKYRVRQAATPDDLNRSLALRFAAFQTKTSGKSDYFDTVCDHILIEHVESSELVCSFRILFFPNSSEISKSYSSQFYGLSPLSSWDGSLLEIGRFCIDPKVSDPDVLRLAWGALAKIVDDKNVDLLFGCSSFEGTDASKYESVFAELRENHLAPKKWLPNKKAEEVIDFSLINQNCSDDVKRDRLMPPLLKTYLLMGGWVSDHAVIDMDMNTLHVFTGVEIDRIPEGRKRLIRAVASGPA